MLPVLLICAGLLGSSPPDRAEYQAAAARAGRDAGAHVKLAVWCEAHGMAAERTEQLAAALAIDPQNAAARAMMGLVTYGGRWLPPDKVGETVKADEAMAARRARYESKRQATPETAEAQWQLALWCEKKGLNPEATAHFTAVTQLAPKRTEAWRKLGCELYRGRWLNAEQVAAERADDEAQKKADKHWQPIVEKWKKELVLDNPKIEQARSALKDITDPRAVPSIQRALGHGNRPQQEMAVELLSQIDCPASSHALAALALFNRWPEVPPIAIQALKRRDPRDFMDAMLGLMHHPLKYHVSRVGPLGSQNALVVEGERTRTQRVYVPQEVVVPNPGRLGPAATGAVGTMIAIGPTAPQDIRRFLLEGPVEQIREIARINQQAANLVNSARTNTDQTLQRDIQAIEQFNARVERANEIVGGTLSQITGESFGGDTDAWLKWWNDKLGLRYEKTEPRYKPTKVRYVQVPVPVFQVHHACFAAGTPVPTLTGPRPIESLAVGDLVLSRDTVTGALSYEPIVGVHHNPPAETLRIRLTEEALVSTPVHRFWRPGRGWAMARDLKAGDFIRTVGGRAQVVAITPDAVQPVFNLDVAPTHSFFVGSQQALVRDNSLPPSMLTPFDAEPSLASIAEATPDHRAPGPRPHSSMLGGSTGPHSR
jgi:hypothetical protein